MHQSNWFEDRARSLIIASCNALEALDTNDANAEVQGQLKQILYESLLLYHLASQQEGTPSLNIWMNGGSEKETRLALAYTEKLWSKPSSCAVWLERFSKRIGDLPPEEWKE